MQHRIPLGASKEFLIQQEVDDALAATASQRIEAASILLDSAYSLWISQGFDDDQGLFRFPECTQQRHVRYVVIGGMAVLSYLPYRTTRDIDVLIEATPENAAAARRAVQLWGGYESRFTHRFRARIGRKFGSARSLGSWPGLRPSSSRSKT